MKNRSQFVLARIAMLLLTVFMSLTAWAENITAEQALQQAQSFLKSHKAANGRRNAPAAAPQMKLAGQVSGLYVFNATDGGFVIVSNDDRTVPVLGYSDSGSFDPSTMPDNMRAWLQGYADEIAWLQQHRSMVKTAPSMTPSQKTPAVKEDIGALVSTRWDQGAPYNNLVPEYQSGVKSATGCVATAMAQVMYYHKWPTAETASIPSYTWASKGTTLSSLPATTFQWSNMINDYESSGYTSTQANAVATLMQYCGWSVQMDYGHQSSSNTDKVATALKDYFGYNTTTTQYVSRSFYNYDKWVDLIYYEVSHQRPVVYGGQSSGGGHEFVVDGYKYEDNTDYFHINWGWGGQSDEYYVLSLLNPYEQGIGGSSSNDGFHYGQDAVIGIQTSEQSASMSDITPNAINLTMNGMSLSSATVPVNTEVEVTISLTNHSAYDYEGDVYLGLYQGGNYSLLEGNDFLIPAGVTHDCVFTLAFDKEGTYNFVLFLPNGTGSYSTNGTVGATLTVVDAPIPYNLAVSDIGSQSAVVSWMYNGDATSWQVAYRAASDESYAVIQVNSNPYTLTGLTPETEYSVMVSLAGETDNWSGEVTFTTEASCPTPKNLAIDKIAHNSSVASWEGKADSYDVRYGVVPDGFISTKAEWLKYDDGQRETCIGIGSNVEWTWGVMYPGSLVLGNKLTKVSFFEDSQYNTAAITVAIYSGGDDGPGTLLYTEVVTPEAQNRFHEVTLATPVDIVPGQNLWITLTEISAYPMQACSSSEPNNQWVFNGGSWGNISAGNSGFANYGWMIRGYIESENLNPDMVDWTSVTTDEKSYKMTGLIPETDYVVQVRGDYGSLGKSNWDSQMFTTLKELTLGNSATDNSDVINKNIGQTVSVILTNRTLAKDGEWNTICLPFEVMLEGSPLEGAEARTLESATMVGTHVTLYFGNAVTSLLAGVPYIIKWDADTENPAIEEPVFDGVTIDPSKYPVSLANDNVHFIGYYDAFGISASDDDIYYMGAGSTLKHTAKARTLKACRAYFRFEEAAQARDITLDFGEGETTAICDLNDKSEMINDKWYDLQGRRVDGSRFTVNGSRLNRGVYIKNGRKLVVK